MTSQNSKSQSSWSTLFLNSFISTDVRYPKLFTIIEIISQLQILSNIILFMEYFSFNPKNEGLMTSLTSLFRIFAFSPETFGKTLFHYFKDFLFVVLVLYLIFIFLLTGSVIFVERLKKELFPLVKAIIHLISNFHSKALFLPCSAVLIEMIEDSTGDTEESIASAISSNGIVVSSYVFLALNLCLALIPSFLNFQPIKSGYIFSHRPCSLDFLDLVFKILCVLFIEIYRTFPQSRWIFYFFTLIIMAFKMNLVEKTNPFHHLLGQRIMLRVFSLQLAATLINLILFASEYQITCDPILVIILAAPPISQFIMTFLKPDLQTLLYSKANNISMGHQKILNIEHILNFSGFQNSAMDSEIFKSEEVYFMGLVKKHACRCEDQNCYCKFYSSETPYIEVKYTSDVNSKLRDFKFKLVKETYEECICSVDKKTDIWLILDFIHLIISHNNDSFPVALSKIHALKTEKLGKIEKHFVDGMISKITDLVNLKISRTKEKLDANNFFEYKSASQYFRADLGTSTEKVLKFWNNYKSNSPIFIQLLDQSVEIHSSFQNLNKDWQILKSKFGMLLIKEYRIYGSFLALVENSPKMSREVLFELNNYLNNKQGVQASAIETITKETIRDERNVTLSISMSKGNLGQILNATPNVKGWLDWQQLDLQGSNINSILPGFLRDFHNQALLDHLSSGNCSIILRNRLVFAQHRKGYLVPCYIYITPDPNITKGFQYIGILRPLRRKCEFLVIKESQEVVGWTYEIGKDLDLEKMTGSTTNHSTLLEKSKISSGNSIENLSNNELKEALINGSIDKCNEIPIFISSKSGYKYSCKLENDSLGPQNLKIVSLEKIGKKSKKKINEKTSFAYHSKTFKTEEAPQIQIQFIKTSEDCLNSKKAIFIDPKSQEDESLYQSFEEFANEIKVEDPNLSKIPQMKSELANAEEYAEDEILDDEDYIESDQEISSESDKFQEIIELCNPQESYKASSLASKKSSNWREMHEIDLMIQERPKATFLNVLILSMIVYLTFILSGTVASNVFSSDLVTSNGHIANIMRDSTLRLYYFLELHRRTRILISVAGNLIPINFTTNYATFIRYNVTQIQAISSLSTQFSDLNNVIGESIYILEKDLINQMYKPVLLQARRVQEPDLYVPLSGVVYEFIQMIVTMRRSAQIRPTNSAANYILKNTLNDILLRSEEIPPILLNAVKNSDSQVNTIIVLLLLALACAFIVYFIAVVHNEVKYVKAKSRYIYMIMRCDEKDIDLNIIRLKDFVFTLGSKIEKGKYAQLSEQQIALMSKVGSDKKGKQSVKRINMRGVNLNTYKRMSINIMISIFALGPIFSLILVFQNYTSKIDSLISNLTTNENILAKYVLLYTEVHEYVTLNNTSTVRGLPILEQLDSDFSYLKRMFTFYNDMDTGDELNNQRVNNLVSGNLCSILSDSISNYTLCTQMAEGSATQGIFGITSFVTRVLNRIQLEYEASKKTRIDIMQKMQLRQLREVEILYDVMFKLPFLEIDYILIDSINLKTNLFQYQSVIIMVICIVSCLVFGYVGWKKYYLGGVAERKDYRMILKLFPTKVVKSQGKIRNYLSSDFGNMFDN